MDILNRLESLRSGDVPNYTRDCIMLAEDEIKRLRNELEKRDEQLNSAELVVQHLESEITGLREELTEMQRAGEPPRGTPSDQSK